MRYFKADADKESRNETPEMTEPESEPEVYDWYDLYLIDQWENEGGRPGPEE